ncbi:MAG: GNAT family N-acetyltransferase [Asgard group archaeon]|nr:GNAT family N-acetyltransferase [Asgard group archaeon]
MNNISRNLKSEEISVVIEENRVEVYRNLWTRFNATIKKTEEYSLYTTEIKASILNGVIDTKIEESNIFNIIDEIVSHFKEKQLPFVWLTSELTTPRNLAENLEKKDFTIARNPGMALNLNRIKKLNSSLPNLEVFKVTDLTSAKKFAMVSEKVYGLSEEGSMAELKSSINDELFNFYLALIDGKPVGISGVYYYCGVAGIYMVGVLEEARGKGIGTTITYAPIYDAKELGYEWAVLYSSELGFNVYKRMGFEQYNTSEVCTWIPK